MKLLLDDSIKSYRLNANEACIYACIAKCTRAGKGWYGNYAALADAMPFVISYKTAGRAINKLLTLGIIEMRDEKLFVRGQIVPNDGQNVPNDGQIVPDNGQIVPNNGQIVLPPITPLNNNNMNEIKKEEKQQPRALCTHDGARQQDSLFEKFWKFFSVSMPAEFQNRKGATKVAFEQRSEVTQRAMVEAAQEGAPGHPGDNTNPYFFVVDFPDPEPQFLSGIEQDNARAAGNVLVQVKHNDLFKICTQQTAEDFGLPIVRIW
jgi:hypothetical protein